MESVVAKEENTLATRERNLPSCVERLHRCSGSKQAPDDKNQKEIDESQFDEEDKIIDEYLTSPKSRKLIELAVT